MDDFPGLLDPMRALKCVELSTLFEQRRAVLALPDVVSWLRAVMVENDLWLPGDELMLQAIREGRLDEVQIAAALCSNERLAGPHRNREN